MDRLASWTPHAQREGPQSDASRHALRASQRCGRSSGQSLVEFALVAPLFLFLLFGVVEYSLINASIGAFNFAAKDAARYGAIIGRGTAPGGIPIDQYMVENIIIPRVNGVVIAQMSEVDIFDASEAGACIANTTSGACQEDIWTQVSGTWTSTSNTWPASSRNDALANADYLGVKISYTYTYLTAFFAITSPTINLTAESIQRIEPQEYGKRFNPGMNEWVMRTPEWWPVALASAFQPFIRADWERQGALYLRGGRA